MSALSSILQADRNLILTGYSGPNQPAIARALAQQLGRRLVVVETRLEEYSGISLDELRATYGQASLKRLEQEVLDEIRLNRGAVIRVNGETLSHGDHLSGLGETGVIICLVAALGAVLRQMHMAMGSRYHNPNERDLAFGELRHAWWARGKPNVYVVDVTDLTTDQIVETVSTLFQRLTIQRG
ncbi:MAG: shikimate kinase [Phototrophicaceae bacterium]|jgi:shikimate kinase